MTTTAPAGDTFQPGGSRRLAPFMITKQHRRFVEFADAVRRHVGNPRYQNLPNDALRVRSAA